MRASGDLGIDKDKLSSGSQHLKEKAPRKSNFERRKSKSLYVCFKPEVISFYCCLILSVQKHNGSNQFVISPVVMKEHLFRIFKVLHANTSVSWLLNETELRRLADVRVDNTCILYRPTRTQQTYALLLTYED